MTNNLCNNVETTIRDIVNGYIKVDEVVLYNVTNADINNNHDIQRNRYK